MSDSPSTPSTPSTHESSDQVTASAERVLQNYRQLARDIYQDSDIEISDDASISPSDGGAFVQAWVWVPAPDAE